jgi:signal transduction histidine kinase
VDGEPRSLPAGVDLAAYRVVQEGLTNALKYAKGAPTEVGLRWDEDALELRVSDTGPGPRERTADGSGHGLVGMKERVRLYGGQVRTGRRVGGGFEIVARLPL